jgi:hypothetical protein
MGKHQRVLVLAADLFEDMELLFRCTAWGRSMWR